MSMTHSLSSTSTSTSTQPSLTTKSDSLHVLLEPIKPQVNLTFSVVVLCLENLRIEMKDEEAQTNTAAAARTTSNATANKKEGSSLGGFLGRRKYKFWALAAILLLAFWSMFTGSVTLKWSSGYLNHVSDDLLDSPSHHDLDILEVEEREKTVRHMWDVYTQSKSVKLPIFWQEAFEAAYEDLINEVPSVRDAAISEIAKMSLVRSTLRHQLEPPSHKSSLRASEKEVKLPSQLGREKVSNDQAA